MKIVHTNETGTETEIDLSKVCLKRPYQKDESLEDFILGLMEEIESTKNLVRSLEDKLESVERELKSEISYVESQIK
jgi:hypothetical protein